MKSKNDFPVDFVIPWVDGSDPVWTKKKLKYQPTKQTDGSSNQRFEDYGTLKYLLRSIDKYANWVNKIWIITDNQVPVWINVNDKIRIIDHTKYIPEDYLPTFNSNVIELNVWRIDDLAEHFVLLNDDLLFINKTEKKDFFTEKGEPRDIAAQSVFMPRDDFSHIPVNNISLINQKFDKKEWLEKNWTTAFNYRNGVALNLLSLLLAPLPYITRFFEPHVGTPYLKKNFIEVWNIFRTEMETTSQNKFREINDVSHWLVRYYQIMTGQIKARSHNFGKYLNITDSSQLNKELKHKKHKMLVLNDNINLENESCVKQSVSLLNNFYNSKGQFEK